MGTPALLSIIEDPEDPEGVFHFRRHYDGYPEYVFPNLAIVLERIRAIDENDSYGLRIEDVAALVAWVGVEEEKNYAEDRKSIGLSPFGKMSTWLPISENAAMNSYFCHSYVLDLRTLTLEQIS
jgi:hypothetical protein